jgi:small subunit ribosomal protein S2
MASKKYKKKLIKRKKSNFIIYDKKMTLQETRKTNKQYNNESIINAASSLGLVSSAKKTSGNTAISRKSKKIKVGDICLLKISALGPKGIGIDEYSYPYSIFVPNTSLGEIVKAKIVKNNLKEDKYAIAQVLEVTKKTAGWANKVGPAASLVANFPVQSDEVLTVNIEKLTSKGAGLVDLKDGYKLIIPNATIGNNIKVAITRLKSKYGFGKIVLDKVQTGRETKIGSIPEGILVNNKNILKTNLLEGSKYTLSLPKVGKYYGKYVIVKLQGWANKVSPTASASYSGSFHQAAQQNDPKGLPQTGLVGWGSHAHVNFVGPVDPKHASAVFIKLNLGAKPGNKVRIKITKVNNKFAVAKIVQINPLASFKKQILVRNSIRQMVKNGMHLGEKAVKCNARMKNYVWLKKQGQNKNRPLLKKGRHIINLLKTRRCLNKALTQLSKYALKGRTFLFIGTKKPASGLIARAALFSKTSFFVNTRWLGGMLTNWKTILKSISKIRPILKEKQKIVADILEKRQTIKVRLIKKALLLKKKRKLILSKGRFLIDQFKNPSAKLEILEKTKKLSSKRKQLVENCYSLLSKRQVLIAKRREIMYQSIVLKEKGIHVISRYKNLLRELTIYSKKLRELKYLLILSNEIKNIKNKARLENKQILNVSYGKVKELINNSSDVSQHHVLPNPPKEILNLILLIMKNKYEGLNNVGHSAEKNLKETDRANIVAKTGTNNKVLVLSKLVSKFSRFAPYLKGLIKTYQQNITEIQNSLAKSANTLEKIKTTLQQYVEFKNLLVKELNVIKSKLVSERNIIRVVKTKLKHFTAQKRLIKFLPRLRYLATPLFTTQISETVKILMQKIVDPKLKYPIDNIYDDKLSNNSKKVATARKKKWQRLEKYFGGIANMTKMTKSQISKNVAIIVGQKEEINAVRECQKLGIKMFNVVDTNCNPSFADHIIPANDDSRNSIKYILNKFLVRIRLAQKLRKKLAHVFALK